MKPKILHDVVINQYEAEDGKIEYEIVNGDEDTFITRSETLIKEIEKADGKRDVNLPKKTIKNLCKDKILTTSRFNFSLSSKHNYIILFNGIRPRKIHKVLNKALIYSSILSFVLGCSYLYYMGFCFYIEEMNLLHSVLFELFIILLHEAGHAIAYLGSDVGIFEIKMTFEFVIPTGGYIIPQKDCSSKGERIQASLAGIEMQLLIQGILCVIYAHSQSSSLFWMLLQNQLTMTLNLLPLHKMDGDYAIGNLISNSKKDCAFSTIVSKLFKKKKLFNSGMVGFASMVMVGLVMIGSLSMVYGSFVLFTTITFI